MQHPPPPSQPTSAKLSAAARAQLLAEVAALSGATLQKLWLVSATQVALQLRVPGRNFLVLVDSALGLASVAEQRPTAPDGAPKSQATLRAALEGARFDGLRLEVARARRRPRRTPRRCGSGSPPTPGARRCWPIHARPRWWRPRSSRSSRATTLRPRR